MKLLKVLSIYLVKISLTTDPAMKVDIDGEISLETPIDIEVIQMPFSYLLSMICKHPE